MNINHVDCFINSADSERRIIIHLRNFEEICILLAYYKGYEDLLCMLYIPNKDIVIRNYGTLQFDHL